MTGKSRRVVNLDSACIVASYVPGFVQPLSNKLWTPGNEDLRENVTGSCIEVSFKSKFVYEK